MRVFRSLLLLLAAVLVLRAAPADAVEGRVVAVQQNATVTTAQGRERLIAGSSVLVGDVIDTGPGGSAQLVFGDDTKIAVGPNARFEVVEALFNRGGSSRFTVTALRGSFRFISGRSPSSSYSINTPTATIGIRGTAFDFAAGGRRGTDVLLLQGAVQICGGSCAVVSAIDSVTNVGSGGQPEAVPPGPLLDSLLQSRFHFQANPDQLTPEFNVAATRGSRSPSTNFAGTGSGSTGFPGSTSAEPTRAEPTTTASTSTTSEPTTTASPGGQNPGNSNAVGNSPFGETTERGNEPSGRGP